nr:immunoglobulin heavy chain junction region [Mus musculus]
CARHEGQLTYFDYW